jgi:DNA repair photolyase
MKTYTTTMKGGISRTKAFQKKKLASFAVNVGTRCGHGCTYCSSPTILRMHPSFKKCGQNPFGSGYAIVDPSTPTRVANDAKKKYKNKRGCIQICTTVDAWAPEARQYDLGRRCLKAILAEPDWTIRVLTKNAAVTNDFDVIRDHRDRVLVGISLTATKGKANIIKVVEPNASSIPERMDAMQQAHKLDLRTYGMLCPLLPGVADSPRQIDTLMGFLKRCGAEEVFVEPVNGRGPGLKNTEQALRIAGFSREADAVKKIRSQKEWSKYVVRLLQSTQTAMRKCGMLPKLRFLLYSSRLTAGAKKTIKKNAAGVIWL